ncbi:MAG: hypothetical protein QE263_04700 [Vampirovibrionales bacterium]|nr:hypothetical protein [Vampirovibrionales bacterium]
MNLINDYIEDTPTIKDLREVYKNLGYESLNCDIDSCDCGGGYPCGHESWVYQIWHPVSKMPKQAFNHLLTTGKYKKYVAEDTNMDIQLGLFIELAYRFMPELLAAHEEATQ